MLGLERGFIWRNQDSESNKKKKQLFNEHKKVKKKLLFKTSPYPCLDLNSGSGKMQHSTSQAELHCVLK